MKKAICLLMALSLAFGIAMPAVAAENVDNEVYMEETSFEGVKRAASGEYAICVPASTTGNQDLYLPVGRLDIDVDTLTHNNSILESTNLEPETKEYIENLKKQALQEGNTDMTITVFSPELLPATRGSHEFYYTTPSGREMKGEYVYAYDLERHVTHVEGTKAAEYAEDIYTLAVIGAGFGPGPLPFIAAGVSLIDFFIDSTGYTAIGGAEDWCYMDIKYDSYTQFTYDHNGTADWCLLLTTQKVLVDRIVTKQHYKVTDTQYRSVDHTIYPNATYVTPNFEDPWDKALASAPYGDSEVLSFKFAGKTFYF